VARDIFSIIPYGVGVEASFSLCRDFIGFRQLKTTGETLGEKVVVRQFAGANNRLWAGTDPELDTMNTDNDSDMKKEAVERKLHRMAKVQDFWRCGRAGKTYVLHRRTPALKTSR